MGSGAGGRFASFVICSSGSSVSSHFAAAVFVETVISLWMVKKHCMSIFDLPYSVGQVREAIQPSLVSYSGELLCSLCHRDGCTRQWEAAEGHLAVVCGSCSQAREA